MNENCKFYYVYVDGCYADKWQVYDPSGEYICTVTDEDEAVRVCEIMNR